MLQDPLPSDTREENAGDSPSKVSTSASPPAVTEPAVEVSSSVRPEAELLVVGETAVAVLPSEAPPAEDDPSGVQVSPIQETQWKVWQEVW